MINIMFFWISIYKFVKSKEPNIMPIKSYLVHPHLGRKEELVTEISGIQECSVIPAKNEDILVVVTEEDILQRKLESIDSLNLLAMVSGFNTPKEH